MTTLTLNFFTTSRAPKAAAKTASQPGLFARLIDAMIVSRQRKADIEIRRHRAIMDHKSSNLDYAMLPFSGE
ncbi:MAG: hypothetical protein ACKVON_10970 [Beijerinckiaceae bacterium]